MGKFDKVLKSLLEQKDIFANIVNCSLFEGEDVIKPEDLKDASVVTNQSKKTRDVLKTVVAKANDYMQFELVAQFGLEAQSYQDYGMILRVMGYDLDTYLEEAEKLNNEREAQGIKKEEFMSLLQEGDKLTPVLTIVINFMEEEWKGATDLHGILQEQRIPQKLLEKIPNYWYPLIDTFRMTDEEREKFDSYMRAILEYQRSARDSTEIAKITQEFDGFKKFPKYVIDVLDTCYGAKIEEDKMNTNAKDNKLWSLKEHLEINSLAKAAADISFGSELSLVNAVNLLKVDAKMYDDILKAAKKHFAELEKTNKQTKN